MKTHTHTHTSPRMKTDSPYLDIEIGATLGFCCTVATVKRDNIIKAKSPVVSLQIQVLSWSCDFFPGRAMKIGAASAGVGNSESRHS